MNYQLMLTNTAKHDLRRLDPTWQHNVAKDLQRLVVNPRPPGVTKLRGTENEWRIRVGNFRIIYEIDENKQFVTILRIRHRREVYR